MDYKIHVQDDAYLDIEEGIENYENVRKGLSMDFELCLEEGYSDILRTPLGYQIRYADIRIKFIRRFPYGIHYFVEKEDIFVIAVFHTSKSTRRWFERLSGK